MEDRRRFAIHMFDRYSSVLLTYECAPCMPSEVRRKGLVWKHGVCDWFRLRVDAIRGLSVSIPKKKHLDMMSLLYEDIVNFVANNLKCSICMDIFTKPVTLVCGHNYCQKCLTACWAKRGKRECPHCRADVSSSKLEMNFTLCDILELQDLGGREKWEQILAETDQVETQHARRTITKVAS